LKDTCEELGTMGDAAIFSYEYSGELTHDCNQWNSSTAM